MSPKASIRQVHNYLTNLIAVPEHIEKAIKASYPLPPIHVSHHTGKLLSLLVQMKKPKQILEVGTLGGISTLWMLEHLEGKLVTVEKDHSHLAVAKQNIQDPRVEFHHGEIQNLLPLDGRFDFVFLDAVRAEYESYFDALIDACEHEALICIDNLLRNGKVIAPPDPDMEVLAAFNTYLADHPRIDGLIVPTFAGLKGGMLDGLFVGTVRP